MQLMYWRNSIQLLSVIHPDGVSCHSYPLNFMNYARGFNVIQKVSYSDVQGQAVDYSLSASL